jgi:hypothetical protein
VTHDRSSTMMHSANHAHASQASTNAPPVIQAVTT